MDELKDLMLKDMKLKRGIIISIWALIVVLVAGGVIFIPYLKNIQGSLQSACEVVDALDIDSLNESIRNLNDVIVELDMEGVNSSINNLNDVMEKFDVKALNDTMKETAALLSNFTAAIDKLSSFSLFK